MAKLATELYAFNLFQITIPNDKVAALDGGEYSINSDPLSGVTAALVYVEELIVETDHYAKIAPIAVNVPMRSGLFVCHDANTSYAPGGKLQLAGNIVLTSDASILTMAFGDLTFCEKMASRYSLFCTYVSGICGLTEYRRYSRRSLTANNSFSWTGSYWLTIFDVVGPRQS